MLDMCSPLFNKLPVTKLVLYSLILISFHGLCECTVTFFHEYIYLSNFFPCALTIDGVKFPSAEHAFQYARANQLGCPEIATQILRAKDSREAERLGSLLTSISEWKVNRRKVMKRVIYEKCRQNQDLKRNLIQTGIKPLFEATVDPYWSCQATLASKQLENGNYRGENQIGKILEEVREAFSGVKACPTAVSKPTPKINPSCTQVKNNF